MKMANLYTSLVRLKQAINGGLPPMTPVPVESQDVINPAFTIGWGALEEDAERGLRCPVRGCGEWFQHLGLHIARSHPDIGLRGVKEKLSIPQTASLVSTAYHDKLSAFMRAENRANHLGTRRAAHARANRKMGQSRRAATKTIGMKNLRNSCPAQLTHKIIDLHHKTGRGPTLREANAAYGEGFGSAVIAVFGTWNNAIAQCGFERNRKSSRYTVETVLPGLAAYYEMHGRLPYVSTVRYGQQTPFLPCATSILRAFGVSSWPEAMRRAAALLGVEGGKYGLPSREGAA
jgi:Homing endonuclease associated repeat